MKEWKLRQQIFSQIFNDVDLGDNIEDQIVIEEFEQDKVIKRALDYIHNPDPTCFYPGKSYATAIIFSLLLQKYFGGELFDYLSDPELFLGEDPYFKPYFEDQFTYDQIIIRFPKDCINHIEKHSLNFKRTVDYFMMEYLFHDKTKMFSPS